MKANEPLHILWDAASNKVKVANNTGKSFANLRAEAEIFNMDGTSKGRQEAVVNSGAGGVATDCFQLEFPPGLTGVHFIKLKLSDSSGIRSENFYWRGLKEDAYLDLSQMPKVTLASSFTTSEANGQTQVDVHLENPTAHVALMTCLKVTRSTAPDERVLPIFYDHNYVSLLPGEKRDLHAQFESALLKGGQPKMMIDGWNVPLFEVAKH